MTPSADTRAWIDRYYEHLDANEIDASLEYFGADSIMVFANEPPLVGRDAIEGKTRQLLGLIDHLIHSFPNMWEPEEGVVIMEGEITYVKKDGAHIKVRGSSVCVVEPNLFLEQRIYVDLSPVFA